MYRSLCQHLPSFKVGLSINQAASCQELVQISFTSTSFVSQAYHSLSINMHWTDFLGVCDDQDLYIMSKTVDPQGPNHILFYINTPSDPEQFLYKSNSLYYHILCSLFIIFKYFSHKMFFKIYLYMFTCKCIYTCKELSQYPKAILTVSRYQ